MRAGTIATLHLAAALLCAPGSALAHSRSVSYSTWRIRGRIASVRVQLSLLDLNGLRGSGRLQGGGDAPSLARYLAARLRLTSPAGDCPLTPGSARALPARDGWRQLSWRSICPAPPSAIRSDLLVETISSHAHFARLRTNAEGEDVERVLTAALRTASLPSRGASAQGMAFGRMVRLGIAHILSGWDHLVFLFLLVLASCRLREVAGVVTGFTAGHSVALVLAALGYLVPATRTIEALIGLSIVIVAVENAWLAQGRPSGRLPALTVVAVAIAAAVATFMGRVHPGVAAGVTLLATCYFGLIAGAERPEPWRWAMALLFGLVHGFGFAGALDWLALPTGRLASSVLGFNLGVELAQVALVLVAWPVLVWLRKRDGRALLVHYGSAVALSAGVFWFLSRL